MLGLRRLSRIAEQERQLHRDQVVASLNAAETQKIEELLSRNEEENQHMHEMREQRRHEKELKIEQMRLKSVEKRENVDRYMRV